MTTSLSANRRDIDEIRLFHAPANLFGNLQKVLVDLIELHLQGKQAHWNLAGTNCRNLHPQLDSIVDTAREASDTIAERMRALDAVPDVRSDAAVSTMRAVHDDVDAADPSTADVLHAIIDALENEAWLLKSENARVQ